MKKFRFSKKQKKSLLIVNLIFACFTIPLTYFGVHASLVPGITKLLALNIFLGICLGIMCMGIQGIIPKYMVHEYISQKKRKFRQIFYLKKANYNFLHLKKHLEILDVNFNFSLEDVDSDLVPHMKSQYYQAKDRLIEFIGLIPKQFFVLDYTLTESINNEASVHLIGKVKDVNLSFNFYEDKAKFFIEAESNLYTFVIVDKNYQKIYDMLWEFHVYKNDK